MQTLLDDLALLQHDQPVGRLQRAEAVRDRERRSTLDQSIQRLLDLLLGLGIDRCRRLVEDKECAGCAGSRGRC